MLYYIDTNHIWKKYNKKKTSNNNNNEETNHTVYKEILREGDKWNRDSDGDTVKGERDTEHDPDESIKLKETLELTPTLKKSNTLTRVCRTAQKRSRNKLR